LKDFSREIKTVKYDLMLNEYPQHIIDSIAKPRRSNHPSGGTILAWSLSHKFGVFLKNYNALGITSMLAEFSRLNIHSLGH
jgi:hypothetical protein